MGSMSAERSLLWAAASTSIPFNEATRGPVSWLVSWRATEPSDQGSQYTSIEFGHRCREADVRPSMGSVGDAYDNAMCESFFATLECELLDRRRFKTQAEARICSRRSRRALSICRI
jgi:transposase InsO family protein